MEWTRQGNRITFSGSLTEVVDVAALGAILREATSGFKCLVADFSGVGHANSVGIFVWVGCLRELKMPVIYEEAPVWLVEVLNVVKDLLPAGSFVRSLKARFYAPASDKAQVMTLVVGRDVPILDDYGDFLPTLTGADGATLEADFEPVVYFHFIARRAAAYRQFLASEG